MSGERVTDYKRVFGHTLMHAAYLTADDRDGWYSRRTLCGRLRGYTFMSRPTIGWKFLDSGGRENWHPFTPDDKRACPRCAARFRAETAVDA